MVRLLDSVVPAFADVATLDAVSPADELQRLGVRVAGPVSEQLERRLLRRRRAEDWSVSVRRAISAGESELLSPLSVEQLRAIASSDEDYELLRPLALQSWLLVPLRARGRTIGALSCSVGPSARRYGEEDLRFAEVLAGRIALALDNAGLLDTVTGLEQRLEATLANSGRGGPGY